MSKALKSLKDSVDASTKREPPPTKPVPMLAKLCHDPFFEDGWIYERKFDGERCLAVVESREMQLRSRNGHSLNDSYPEVRDALEAQELPDCVLDGELVAFRGKNTSFARLQQRMQQTDPDAARASSVSVYYYVFDLPFFDGADLSGIPLHQRKAVLRSAVTFTNRIRYSAHRVRKGEPYFHQTCEKGREGVIAKKADSVYTHGRSPHWLKFKCGRSQEFVVGGFTDPRNSRVGFGALLVGVYRGEDLVYAGKVGTGYDDAFLKDFRSRLDRLERETSPFDQGTVPDREVHFVTPKAVGEVAFTEWTRDGRLRHPRFKGLRRDKSPKDVHRES